MSDKHTILGKVVEAILSVFKSNWIDFIANLWKKVPDELKDKLIDIVQVVNRIKEYVDSPAVDLITYAVPGSWDDETVAWLRKVLQEITGHLNIKDKPTSEYTASDLHNIATLLTKEVTGLSYGQSAVTIENAFQNS